MQGAHASANALIAERRSQCEHSVHAHPVPCRRATASCSAARGCTAASPGPPPAKCPRWAPRGRGPDRKTSTCHRTHRSHARERAAPQGLRPAVVVSQHYSNGPGARKGQRCSAAPPPSGLQLEVSLQARRAHVPVLDRGAHAQPPCCTFPSACMQRCNLGCALRRQALAFWARGLTRRLCMRCSTSAASVSA